MPRLPVSDDEISVPAAAKLLGLEPRTVRDMIERGELHCRVTYVDEWAKRRRAFHLTRQDVDDVPRSGPATCPTSTRPERTATRRGTGRCLHLYLALICGVGSHSNRSRQA